MKKLLVILDSGHGGMVDGVYITAPSKQFKHADGTWAYEGVLNRKVKAKLMEKLKLNKIAHFDVTPFEADIPPTFRVANANMAQAKYPNHQCLYLSIHSNAGGGLGTGFELFTSPGKTKSDEFATIFGEQIQLAFPNIAFRKDIADGDLDKEAKFYVLVHTAMPAVLVELLFFDNPTDWAILQTEGYYNQIADALVAAILRSQTEITT